MLKRQSGLNWLTFACAIATLFSLSVSCFGQSTGAIQGTVLDATSSPIPHAAVTIKNQLTGEERTLATDSAGLYYSPSLPVGTYTVEVKASGMSTMEAKNLEVPVGTTVRQNFTMKVAATSEVVEVHATAPVIEGSSDSVGSVVNQTIVQEIPLNGRHFVDLSLLTVGTVTPPANGFLTAPLRGQGSFAFNSAGAREDSINFMVNGINLSDPNQNQITFQPTINTVSEFKLDNQTFSAEYGRNSGSVVNIATRTGENTWHGEAYEFMRNDYFDARNFGNPTNTVTSTGVLPNKENQFIRNQFGGDGGGAIKKDKAFVFLSYEGLRQRQSVSLSGQTLSAAQVAQAQAGTDSIIKQLLPLIPAPNTGTNTFSAPTSVPVNIEQGTVNFSYNFSQANRVNVYYAIQRDQRNEPASTDANTFPEGGDQRNGKRQLFTFVDSWVISPSMVNEARLGYNRIYITFAPDNIDNPAAFGISDGVNAPIGLPQIIVSGAFEFGGINGFPQGRGDNTEVASDTMSWIHGNHTVKFGGEFRRANSDNFSYTPGTFTFPSVTAFLADQATGFTANSGNSSNRSYVNSMGAFITDSWKVTPRFTANIGVRYDWYGTPTEAASRYVVFDPASDTLQHVGQPGGFGEAYNQSALNFEPRVGFAWDVFGNGRTVVRSAYAIMTDQPILGEVTPLAANPPYAFPVSYAPTAAVPFVTLANAYKAAGGSVGPYSIAHNFRDAYASEWNFNVQHQFHNDYAVTAGYYASKGTALNIERNYNQPVNGVKPYPTLAVDSPIDPSTALGNIIVSESDGNSSYNGLWLTATKSFSSGLQFNVNYAWSKSIDENSRNHQGYVVQNSYDISGDRGLSDFDVRNRIVISGVYDLPFKKNRFVEGWELSLIQTCQSGNPINFHTSNASFTGEATLRPDVSGPVQVGFQPAFNGSVTSVGYIENPSVFYNPGNAFGTLGRNVIIGPGISNLDFSIQKSTKLFERLNWVVRAEAFDLLNQENFTNPVSTVGSSTFGLITGGTRFPSGDFGTSRQLQVSMKLIF
jgi:hypothetical protein